jgi:uncharacterized phiE125 gp8 family phage protein
MGKRKFGVDPTITSLVTLAEAKAHLQLTTTAEDTILQVYIEAAESYVQAYTGTHFNLAPSTAVADNLDGDGSDLLIPSKLPILTVTSITDNTDASRVVAASDFVVKPNYLRAILGHFWPAGLSRWKVVYTAGYTVSSLPKGLKSAILMIVSRLYDNRGDFSSKSEGLSYNWTDLAAGNTKILLDRFRLVVDIA